MRAALTALTDELKRLKATGVTSVPVSEESLAALRKVLGSLAKKKDAAVSAEGAAKGTEPSIVVRALEGPAPASSSRAPAAQPATPAYSKPETRESRPKPAAAAETALPPPPVVTLPAGDKTAQWTWLRDLVIHHPVCKAGVRAGKQVVLGVGSLESKIMFVGEAPGAEEEVRGEPFVGPAGQLLNRMIQAMGLKREDIYIGNIMNWRPQVPTPAGVEQVGNRAPTAEEMAFCLPFLLAQIEIVKPELVVALGATAAQGLLGAGSFKTLGEVRGQWKQFADRPVIVTYHPSYLLRQEAAGPVAARKAKRSTWEDLLKVMGRANLPISDKQRGYFLEK